jgi:hypothetical protein
MSLLYPDALPYHVTIGDEEFEIRPQYYIILGILKILQNEELEPGEQAAFSIDVFYGDETKPTDPEAAMKALQEFIERGSWSNGYQGKPAKEELLDWEYDAPFIWASMKQAYPFWDWSDAHWWEFKAAFDSLPETTKIKEVMRIRSMEITSEMDATTARNVREMKNHYRINRGAAAKHKTAKEIEAELKRKAGV